jgi:hypothetical protein
MRKVFHTTWLAAAVLLALALSVGGSASAADPIRYRDINGQCQEVCSPPYSQCPCYCSGTSCW